MDAAPGLRVIQLGVQEQFKHGLKVGVKTT
jgi:hypothetical protein